MKIATEVFYKKYKAELDKDLVESIMMKFSNIDQKIPQLIIEILKLYETMDAASIRILYNQDLNGILDKLASLSTPYITKANKEEVVQRIKIDYGGLWRITVDLVRLGGSVIKCFR